jgi:hypothetical protein
MLRALDAGNARQDSWPAERLEAPLAGLVLDGVLELATADGWISGPAAAQAVGAEEPASVAPTGKLGLASWAALRYAGALEGLAPAARARRLYCYGRLPASPWRAAELPLPRVVRDRLDGGPFGAARRTLARRWRAISPPLNNERWRIFALAHTAETALSNDLAYKLYVSPLPDDFPTVFGAAIGIFVRLGVPCFKVADDVEGILRPDKFVAYFPTRERLDEVADALASEVSVGRAHGVPFTAEIAGDGLLSWAVDPPRAAAMPSWRAWVTLRAAWALWTAETLGANEPPWRYALRRLVLDGVDVATWIPRADRYSRSAWDW